jgi:hypothetical protein
MRFLLTSAGVKNTSIHDALVDLLGKPIAESTALVIPTALHGMPGGAGHAWRLISGREPRCSFCELGLSAGSMVMAPNIGEDFVRWSPPTGGDSTLGLVDFAMFPHLDNEDLPGNSMADAEKWSAGVEVPGYAIDDQTAIQVTDGAVEVVSEGTGNCSPVRTESDRQALSISPISAGFAGAASGRPASASSRPTAAAGAPGCACCLAAGRSGSRGSSALCHAKTGSCLI